MLTGFLRRPVGRGVGELEVLQVIDRHPGADRDREDVDALVDTVPAEHLRAQQLALGPAEQHLQEQRRGTRVVPGMTHLVGVNLAVVHACRAQLGLGQAGATGRHVEQP